MTWLGMPYLIPETSPGKDLYVTQWAQMSSRQMLVLSGPV